MKFWTMAGRWTALAVFALAVASCDHAPTPTDVAVQEQSAPQELLGLEPLLGGATTVQAENQYGVVRRYELIREPVLDLSLSNLSVTQLIGANGGTITLLGHRLTVPAGAVSLPTAFTLAVVPTGYVQVDVTALAPGLLGNLLNVGERGFDRPVRLDLTYYRATNVRDARKLVILRLNPDGMDAVHEALPSTVDRSLERVTVWLEHFSGYAMAQ